MQIWPTCKIAQTLLNKAQPEEVDSAVIPNGTFKVYICGDYNSEFFLQRPTVARRLSFCPNDCHAYNENHGFVPVDRKHINDSILSASNYKSIPYQFLYNPKY